MMTLRQDSADSPAHGQTSAWRKGAIAGIVAGIIAVLVGFTYYMWGNTDKGAGAIPTQGLVGSWSFNGSSVAGTQVKDISGAGNNGVLVNGPELVSGIIGQALQLDGVDDYLDAGSGQTLNNLPALTVSAWIYPRIVNGGEHILGKGGTSKVGWLLIFDTNARLRFLAYFTEGVLEQTSEHNVIQTNSWQHLLVTWDGSATGANVKMYVNGSEIAYGATFDAHGNRQSDAGHRLYMGDSGALFPYNGVIDGIRVYNRVLAADEAKKLSSRPH